MSETAKLADAMAIACYEEGDLFTATKGVSMALREGAKPYLCSDSRGVVHAASSRREAFAAANDFNRTY